jgi:hypothetical protein
MLLSSLKSIYLYVVCIAIANCLLFKSCHGKKKGSLLYYSNENLTTVFVYIIPFLFGSIHMVKPLVE